MKKDKYGFIENVPGPRHGVWCIKMEHGRYNGNLHWVGMNTEIITAKKAARFF